MGTFICVRVEFPISAHTSLTPSPLVVLVVVGTSRTRFSQIWGGVIGSLGLEEGNEGADFYAVFYNDHVSDKNSGQPTQRS